MGTGDSRGDAIERDDSGRAVRLWLGRNPVPDPYDPAERVPLRLERSCEECGKAFLPMRPHHAYCSDRCRLADFKARQPNLLFPADPLPPVVDQRVTAEDAAELSGHNRLILQALQAGPKTGRQLEAILGAGSAWRTRVSDVRRWLWRLGQTVACRRMGKRVYLYSIENERE